jgi:plant 4alpha-monomethylsterol monooxygenase
MDALWLRLTEGRGNFFLYAVLPTIVVTLAYLLGSFVAFAIDRLEALRTYKLQPKVHDAATWRACLRHVFLHKLTSEIPLTFAGYPVFVWIGVSRDTPLPSVVTVFGTLALSFVIEDAWHYFAHRALHTRWAYKHIHGVHHRYTTPFGPAANFAHPIETFFTGFGTLLAVIVLRPHLSTMLVWVAVRQWQAISVHIGYSFPVRPSRILPFMGGAQFHDTHHRRPHCNFAPTFVWLDRLFRTDEDAVQRARTRAS